MTSSRPELILSLNLLKPSAFHTQAQVAEHLKARAPEIDCFLIQEVINFAVDKEILTLVGAMYLRHRTVSLTEAEEFERKVRAREQEVDPDTGRMAMLIRDLPRLEQRIKVLESQVGLLMVTDNEDTRWLRINMERIPRPVYAALRAQAVSVLGGAATDDEIHEQMVAVASQLLQEAVRPMMGRA